MAPEYGATCGFFPVDDESLEYMRLTGRDEEQIQIVETYCKENGLFFDPDIEIQFIQKLLKSIFLKLKPIFQVQNVHKI